MMKQILSGVWVGAVALGASYAGMALQNNAAGREAAERKNPAMEQLKIRKLSVPFVSGGALQGYVVAQLAAVVRSRELKAQQLKPEPVIIDEAFRVLYANEAIDFRNPKVGDLNVIAKQIADGVNARLAAKLVDQLLIEEINYVPRADLRTGRGIA